MRKSTSIVNVAGSSYRLAANFLGNEVQFVAYDEPPSYYNLSRSNVVQSLPAVCAALLAVIIAKCVPF
jgi:hypothetical protein